MPGNASRPLRLAAEFATIVLGVFVALAGEAWWEDRREAAQEAENLSVLASDLFAADTVVTRVIREDSTFAVIIREDLTALATRDTTHTLRLPLTISEYRLRTGGLDRALASSGPVLEGSPELNALLSDLQAELRTVGELNATMTGELFRYVQGTVRIQETIRVAEGALTNATLLSGLAVSPEALSSIAMVTVILQNRDALHRRLQALLRDVRDALDAEGFAAGEAEMIQEPSPAGSSEGTHAEDANPNDPGD